MNLDNRENREKAYRAGILMGALENGELFICPRCAEHLCINLTKCAVNGKSDDWQDTLINSGAVSSWVWNKKRVCDYCIAELEAERYEL